MMESNEKKVREDKLFLYANDLYRSAFNKEFKELHNYLFLRTELESKGWLINITPEVGKGWVNWNWQILVLYNDDYDTGMYGDNGEFKSSFAAIKFSTVRALELYLLSKTAIDEDLLDYIFNKKIKIVRPIKLDSLLDLILFLENRVVFLKKIDDTWFDYKRESSEEFINYIKERIWLCLDV